MKRIKKRSLIIIVLLVGLLGFMTWRFIRPLHIFVIDKKFERPVSTAGAPGILGSLSAKECGACHQSFYREWKTSMHANAWTDPYFQADWKTEGRSQICKNCHIPLDRQQPQTVVGFHGGDKWAPILKPNPQFDPSLQHEGVTCAGCHLRNGKIQGPAYANVNAPHPVEKLADTNEICVRCHVVPGKRWDTFYRFPPCGTVAEIESGRGEWHGRSGELKVLKVSQLGCVQCHMPAVRRPLVEGDKVRLTRRHLWRGGHDPEMVKQALDIQLAEAKPSAEGKRNFALTLTNVGATHYVPTGVPDRFLSVDWRLLDEHGTVLRKQQEILQRTVMWRPFIIDLWDTRLAYRKPRTYHFTFSLNSTPRPTALEVVVRYHLLPEAHRRRDHYHNKKPIAYAIYRKKITFEVN